MTSDRDLRIIIGESNTVLTSSVLQSFLTIFLMHEHTVIAIFVQLQTVQLFAYNHVHIGLESTKLTSMPSQLRCSTWFRE